MTRIWRRPSVEADEEGGAVAEDPTGSSRRQSYFQRKTVRKDCAWRSPSASFPWAPCWSGLLFCRTGDEGLERDARGGGDADSSSSV
mmetsp:Transcript_11941/g.18229  ORF Transcript_11941/g.18229 Transcript_11941/m.18229 type:complete len:87 (-) Transcript_11941:9-269(-)